jgi:hypothetical protein
MEPINKVIEDIRGRFDKLGLYLVDVNVATNDEDMMSDDSDEGQVKEDFRKKLANGEAVWVVQATFTIGKQAFTDRVLNPEQFKEDTEFRTIMPTEVELVRDRYSDPAVQEALASGDFDRLTELLGEDDDEGEDSPNP